MPRRGEIPAVLFEQYHLRRLDEAFLLVTARSGTSTPRSPG
jgi:hypothetical protein